MNCVDFGTCLAVKSQVKYGEKYLSRLTNKGTKPLASWEGEGELNGKNGHEANANRERQNGHEANADRKDLSTSAILGTKPAEG